MDLLKMRAKDRARGVHEQADRERIAEAVRAGTAGPRDRFGFPIREGSQVLFVVPLGLVYDVVSVEPVLDPRLPPGLVNVTLTVTVPVPVQLGQPRPDMVAIHVERPAPAVVATDATPEPSEEPPREPEDNGAGA